jgi:hopene-associated glycosyltransferase HpnB
MFLGQPHNYFFFLSAAAILSLVIWGYLLVARGAFWQTRRNTGMAQRQSEFPGLVAVIVPARDEAEVVGECVRSLLGQTGVPAIRVFLVDDASTDRTAQVARAAAEEAGRPECLMILDGKPLAPGWSGKLWAVQQGVEKAVAAKPQFFLLTDADIVHSPDSIATLIAIAESGPYDLASFMVQLHCVTFAEKLLVPAFVFFFFMLYPPRWIADPRRRTAGAAGGCILVRPEWLEQAGGVRAIRNEVIDDCALAARVKSAGGRLWLGLTASARSIRPYRTMGEMGRMISRTAFNQLRHSIWMLLVSLLGLTLVYLAPPLLLLGHNRITRLFALAAVLAMTAAYLPMVRFYRLGPLWALTLPVAAIFYMGATVHSAWKFWAGRGGEWKGRVQDPQGKPVGGQTSPP